MNLVCSLGGADTSLQRARVHDKYAILTFQRAIGLKQETNDGWSTDGLGWDIPVFFGTQP